MPELELRLVRYFTAVVEHGSFTRAAAALHVSQPALSQAVRRLETLVGAELIQRRVVGSRGGVTLTVAGSEFLAAAEELLIAADRALHAVSVSTEPVLLRIGFGTDTPRSLTRRLLQIADLNTSFDVTLHHLRWGTERSALAYRDVDLTFLQAPPDLQDRALRLLPVDIVRRVAVFHALHPLARRNTVMMHDLDDEPIIDAASNRAYWLVDPRPDGRTPRTVGPPASTVDEMLALVSAGQGMAITSSTVASTNQSDELVFIPILDLDPAAIYLAARADDRRSTVQRLLREMLRLA